MKGNCPTCNSRFDSSAPIKNKLSIPKEGDPSICLYCGAWLTFNKDLSLREITEKDLENFKSEELEVMKRITLEISRRGTWVK